MAFRCLPEYIVEDIVDYLYFAVQCVFALVLGEPILTLGP